MHLNEYQEQAMTTAVYPMGILRSERNGALFDIGLIYAALGLVNEAGEFAGKIKKDMRDKLGALDEDTRVAMIAELGDVLWYVAAVATELGYTLEDIAKRNIIKLADRAERNVIKGDGDDR